MPARSFHAALTPVVLLAAPLVVASSAPADAAVRRCMTPITSDIVPARSEPLGKRLALASWVSKARQRHGDAFVNWRLANRKVLACVPSKTPGSALECVAYGAPCRIEQVPSKPLPKATPPGGGAPPTPPSAPGREI